MKGYDNIPPRFVFVEIKKMRDSADSADKALFSQVRGGKVCPTPVPQVRTAVRTGVDRKTFAQVRGGEVCPTGVGQEWDRCGQTSCAPLLTPSSALSGHFTHLTARCVRVVAAGLRLAPAL